MPDPVTDDTDALSTLLASGGIIHLEPRIYRISRVLIIGVDGTWLIGNGLASIQKTRPCQVLLSANSCRMDGLTFDGNRQGGNGLFITGSFNLILNCSSANNLGHGFGFDGGHLFPDSDLTSTKCKYNEIRSCVAAGNDGVGIAQYHHWDGRIVNNMCLDNGLEGITIDVWSLRSLVSGNSIQNNCRLGGVGAIGMDFADLNRVVNNFIEQAHDYPGTLLSKIGQGRDAVC
jgi:hypothetical protein